MTHKIKTPDDRLFFTLEDELEASFFAIPYTAPLDEVLDMFNEQAWYAQAGYQATIDYGNDGKVTLTWKRS